MSSSGWRQRGVKGAYAAFNAVYESNPELQKISENAIFGDATPNGNLALTGEFAVEKIIELTPVNDEWYIDLDEKLPGGASILTTPLRLAFQGEPSQGSGLTDFRWVGLGDVHVVLQMSIANPKAVAWLSDRHQVFMTLRHCDGLRTPDEIKILEKVLADQITHADENALRYWHGKTPDEITRLKLQSTYWIRKKVALAKGEKFTESW